jgi:uncharacterized protein (TIRG00374 family)
MMRVRRALAISVVAAFVFYAASSFLTGTDDVLGAVARVDAATWIQVLALSALNYFVRFYRWQWYLARLGHSLPAFRHLLCYLAGFAFTTTPVKAGEAIRSLYLRPDGVAYADSLAALFVERFLDLLAILMLALLVTPFFSDVWWPSVCAAALMAAVFVTVVTPTLRQVVPARLERSRSPRLRRFGGQLHSLLQSSDALLRPRMLLPGVVLGIVSWVATGIGFYLILRALEFEASVPAAVGVFAAGMLIGALSFIPGGLGSTEASMVVMLSLMGMDVPVAIAATIVCRVATLWFAVALGFCAFAVIEARREHELNPQ